MIDASLLPKAGSLHVHSPPSEKAPLADYNKVRQGLETLHASQGMPQFHQTMSVLESVRDFIKAYPNSPLYASMKSVEQSLLNAINKATPPVEYPFAWERIETQRSHLDEDSIGRGRQSKKATVLGTNVHIQSAANSDPGKMARVLSAVETALHKLSQGDPHIAKAMAANFKVLIANPGELPESTLRLSNPPALVIGDDFFAPVSTDDTTVADRLGRESQVTGGDAVAHKQAAMICGKLGMLGYYKADSQGFLEVIRAKYVMRDGDTLSKRASRGPGDFVEEAYTARLYDGKLDSRTDAALNRLFTPVAETSDAVNKSTRGPGFSNSGTSPVLPAGASNSGVASNLPVGSSNVGAAPKAKPDGPRTQHPPSVFAPPPLKLEHVNDAEMLRLQKLDDVGPLITIGEKAFSRVELYKMGWSINGKPIDKALADDPSGRQLADVMRLDYPSFKAYLRSGGSDDNAHDALAEIASLRSTGAPALIAGSDGSVLAETLQKSAHDLSRQADEIRKMLDGKKPLPADFFSSGTPGKQGATSSAGSGFQLFSTFQGLRSSIESIQRGDTTAGIIGLGAVGADYVGMGVETALNKVAEKVFTRAAPTILSFQASSVGKMIGKAARGGGSVISIPFDTYTAVDSFKKAGRSTGKEAQDHYVNGSFAVANAATSIALGAAFLAGASSAGPAGLIVAGGLMIAQAIYSAVRTVEDIDKYTPLTGGQKFTLGLTSFLGFPPGFKVMKPYLQAKYSQAHEEQTRANYKAFLEGPGKDHYERVVYGNTKVEVTEVPGKVPLTPSLWWNPPSWGLHQIKVDGKVPVANVRGGNDRINAPEESWNGMSIKPVEGVQGGGRGTFWVLGDGDDVVAGVMKKHNYFSFEGGKKLITGGDADDTFNFNADARQTVEQTRQVQDTEKNGFSPKASEIWGGDGTNTLSFSGELRTTYSVVGETETVAYSGHVINFKTGTVAANTLDSKTNGVTPIAYFHSFSNAVTVESGESFIQGDDQNNHLTLNGKKDVVLTGKGANVIVVNGGANIVGQGGFNTYEINKGNQAVTINDPVASVIKLDYSASQVFDWGVTPEGDLVATLHGDKPWEHRYLFIKNAYPDGSTEDTAKPTFVTNDGVMITINAPRKAGSDDRVVQVNRLKIDAPKV